MTECMWENNNVNGFRIEFYLWECPLEIRSVDETFRNNVQLLVCIWSVHAISPLFVANTCQWTCQCMDTSSYQPPVYSLISRATFILWSASVDSNIEEHIQINLLTILKKVSSAPSDFFFVRFIVYIGNLIQTFDFY